MRKFILLIFFLTQIFYSEAQGMVQIKGIVYDADSNSVLDSVTVIVKHTSRIMQNRADGSFSVFILPTDTLIFGLYGYKVKYLCFKDSGLTNDLYNVRVKMYHLSEEINEITIREVRTQREIRRDLNDLVINHLFDLERSSAFQSPISYLYEKNSKKAHTRQLLADYNYELARNQLITQLLDIYNKQGIIDLPTVQYKAFVESLNMSWDNILYASDYELAVFIKQKALAWKN